MSKWAKTTIELETPGQRAKWPRWRTFPTARQTGRHHLFRFISYRRHDRYSCSMKTLAGIRAGYAEGLVGRAADVVLKEGRKLVLVPREMPLSTIHLENMLALSRMGVAMVPPMPAYYNHPETVDDITNHIVTRVLDQFGLDYHKARRWNGLRTAEQFAQEIE